MHQIGYSAAVSPTKQLQTTTVTNYWQALEKYLKDIAESFG